MDGRAGLRIAYRNQKSYKFNFFSRTQTVEAARAEAERVRLIGAAEARAIEAVGRAEAEKMRMKASAYKQYGDAAVMALVLEALPQVHTDLLDLVVTDIYGQGSKLSLEILRFVI